MKKFGCILVLLTGCCLFAGAEDPPGPEWVPQLLTQEEAAEGFFPLFNGQDLDGWWIRGDNKEAVVIKDGVLAITGKGADWVFTTREYENFVLRYEYRVPPEGGNSGVAIRATREGNPAFTGMEIQVCEPIDPPHAGSAGALYSSAAPAVKADNPVGEWNMVEVICDGPRIRTSMNGKQLYDIKTTDETKREDEEKPLAERAKVGHIALQDHGDYVEFRKIRLKPLPGGEGWRPLFNGKDLEGWTVVGDATWSVPESGMLRVDGSTLTTRSELRSIEEFKDFEMRLSVRPHKKEGGGGANSGVFFRGSGDAPWPRTYEAQVDNHDPRQFTGAIWDQVPASELRAMDDCWFLMDIRAVGPMIQVAVNGKTVVDYISSRHDKFPTGWFSLQGHDPKSVVDFKDIEIKVVEEKPEGQ